LSAVLFSVSRECEHLWLSLFSRSINTQSQSSYKAKPLAGVLPGHLLSLLIPWFAPSMYSSSLFFFSSCLWIFTLTNTNTRLQTSAVPTDSALKRKRAPFSPEFSMDTKDTQGVARLVLRVLQEMECFVEISRSGLRIAGHAPKNTWNRKARREGARSTSSTGGEEEGRSPLPAQVLVPFLPSSIPAQALFGLEVLVSKRDNKEHVSVLWIPPADVKGGETENQSRVHFQQFFEFFYKKVASQQT